MSRRNKSNTATTLTKHELNRLITDFASRFSVNSSIPLSQFHLWFSVSSISDKPTIDEVRRHDFNMLTIYTTLNRLLRKRGLVLKKSKDEYLVLALESAQSKAESYVRESHRLTYQYGELTEGIQKFRSSWTPLTDGELARIKD